jgi:hypothetical protein
MSTLPTVGACAPATVENSTAAMAVVTEIN